MNVFYRIPPDETSLQELQQQVEIYIKELEAEMQVQFLEKQVQMQEAVESGDMLQERYELEIQNEQKLIQ